MLAKATPEPLKQMYVVPEVLTTANRRFDAPPSP
jgi:hypothetical protein